MNSLEFIHQSLADREDFELLFHVDQAILQRDRLLYGVNARAAELHALEKETALLRDRYNLLQQKYNQLHVCNQELLRYLATIKEGLNG